MSYTRIGNFMIMAFIGGLGLFNSSKLEMRQSANTNAELIFQNGQIISCAIIFLCFSGIIAECLVMRKSRKKKPRPNPLITIDDDLTATEFYDKYAEDSSSSDVEQSPQKVFGGVSTTQKKKKKAKV
jgi:hypothetical protein